MARTNIGNILSKLDDAEVSPFYAVELFFDTETLRVWTGFGDILVSSGGNNTYNGLGELLSISDVQESQDVSAKGVNLTLSGIPSNLLVHALSTPYQGRLCNIHFGFIDWSSPTNQSGILVFTGYMDTMLIDEGAETSTITTSIESRLIDLERPRNRRYTSESQKQRNTSALPTNTTGDLAFDFVESLQNQRLQWGGGG
tara:strand:- start:384 stop:980 length:597 start_codon:yes stop_codon:yes gene_type:complete